MNKKDLSERDICSKFISSAVKRAGWDGMMQIREEVNFTKGRIVAQRLETASASLLRVRAAVVRLIKHG
jgi:type I site-specific restriction endonuclease